MKYLTSASLGLCHFIRSISNYFHNINIVLDFKLTGLALSIQMYTYVTCLDLLYYFCNSIRTGCVYLSICIVYVFHCCWHKWSNKLKRCSKKECCKQCRHVKCKGTMTKWPVQSPTNRTTQKHVEHQDVTDN